MDFHYDFLRFDPLACVLLALKRAQLANYARFSPKKTPHI
jgi:hypothetical protein